MSPDEIAREAWWPHHASRTRHLALAELDAGATGNVSLEFEDVRRIVEYALASPKTVTPDQPQAVPEVLEEAVRLAEIGEYLYSACAYSYGDGHTEPREYGIEWQWQQSKPDEYGQGMLLAASTKWHEEQAEGGTITEALKLRAALAARPVLPVETPAEGLRAGVEWAIAQIRDHEKGGANYCDSELAGNAVFLRQTLEACFQKRAALAPTAPAPLSGRDGNLREACPDCGRPKARNVGDAAAGDCPKWWAVTDKDADADCARAALAAVPPKTAEIIGTTYDGVDVLAPAVPSANFTPEEARAAIAAACASSSGEAGDE